MPVIQLRKYKVVQFHSHLHNNIDNAHEYIIFVRYLYRVNDNQKATGGQHSDIILGLGFFLTSRFKPDYKIILLQASIYLSILKISASNFQ